MHHCPALEATLRDAGNQQIWERLTPYSAAVGDVNTALDDDMEDAPDSFYAQLLAEDDRDATDLKDAAAKDGIPILISDTKEEARAKLKTASTKHNSHTKALVKKAHKVKSIKG
jgi:hypothetical protein